MNNFFYVLAFDATSHSMQVEKLAREEFEIAVMPTPTEISASCGLAIRFKNAHLEEIKTFTEGLSVPAYLYALGNEKINGKRAVEKIC